MSDERLAMWLEIRNSSVVDAENVLLELNINQVPVPVFHIARLLGVTVKEVKGAKWDGAVESNTSGEATIYVSVDLKQTLVRQSAIVAHALGHLMLHPVGKVFRDNLDTLGDDKTELEAIQFASELLMPHWLVSFEATNYNLKELANVFEVPALDMAVRLESIGFTLERLRP